jgi:hypothetical protein
MKHDHASGIAMLLLNANPHARGLSSLPKFGEVPKPFTRAPRKWNVRRCRVKEVEPRLADDREIQRTVECPFACLLEIDCAQDSSDGRHAVSLMPGIPSDGGAA